MATVATIVGTPLAAMRGLDGGTIARLRSLAIDTAEQVLEAADVAPRELEGYLGADAVKTIVTAAGNVAKMPSATDAADLRGLPCALGVDLEKIPRSLIADAPVLPPESQNVQPLVAATCSDHRAAMPPIQHQQTRPTCVAFATVAVLEHWLGVNGAYQDMSEQFAYWNCKANDGFPNSKAHGAASRSSFSGGTAFASRAPGHTTRLRNRATKDRGRRRSAHSAKP